MQTLHDFIIFLLGQYTPIYNVGETVTNTISDVSGNELVYTVTTTYSSSIDWSYVITGLLFVVCIWSIFKLFGIVVSKIFGGDI